MDGVCRKENEERTSVYAGGAQVGIVDGEVVRTLR